MIVVFRIIQLAIAIALLAACSSLKTPVFSTPDGAIRGYDPVAYHEQGRPRKGRTDLRYEYNGSQWYFSEAENLTLFKQNPQQYVPEYGGYCAYAMSKNLVVSTDPEAWHIENDKLYLNYSPGVRETWLRDIPGYVEKADENWQQKTAATVFE